MIWSVLIIFALTKVNLTHPTVVLLLVKKRPKTKLLYKQINMKKNNSTRPHKKRTTKNIWCYANGCGTPRYSICLYFSNKRKVFIWLLSLSPNQLLDKTMLLGKPSKLISQCYLVNSDCLHWFVFLVYYSPIN